MRDLKSPSSPGFELGIRSLRKSRKTGTYIKAGFQSPKPHLIENKFLSGQLTRIQLRELAGGTWNGIATLKIDNADNNVRPSNLKLIKNGTFSHFSC